MKKIITITLITAIVLSIAGGFATGAEFSLINNMKITLKSTESPNRLEVSFDLTEQLDLSHDGTDIIFEYFTTSADGGLEAIGYRKDKSWAGYLNIYDDYPAGERKYSSGTAGADYPDIVPAATVYTSVKTGGSINAAQVAAVKVTVLRAEGSGESFTGYSNVTDVSQSTGIRLEATAQNLPINTVVIAEALSSGDAYKAASEALAGVGNFAVFDIKLEAEAISVVPNGNVKLNIPIPNSFNNPYLKVYRIDEDGAKTPYTTSVTTIQGTAYATFETMHFSTYALLELPVYPYTVSFYRDSIEPDNLIDLVVGGALFAEGHQLTVEDITTDLGAGWIDSKIPAEGFFGGTIRGGYPVISPNAADNHVTVLYRDDTAHHTITVEYKDTSGNSIAEQKNAPVTPGAPYSVTAHAIAGYRYTDTAINGTVGAEMRTVTIESADMDYSIVFRYELDRPVLNRISHDWYINGYEDNTLRPDAALTRVEAAMIFYRLVANVDKDIKTPRSVLSDVNPNDWYATAVTYLYDYDIISGYADMTFRPEALITRAEIAKLASMFDNLEIPVETKFSDVPKAHWAYSYIASAAHKGWVSGYEDGTFRPDSYATRAEIILLINRALNRLVKTEKLLPGVHIWADISRSHPAYADMMEAAHSHTFTRDNDSDYETWLSIKGTGR